ncbi:MAG: hypothetical protein ACRC2G_03600, partial [Aestuariivirga sp.]
TLAALHIARITGDALQEIGTLARHGLYELRGPNGAGKTTLMRILAQLGKRSISGLSDGRGVITEGQATATLRLGSATLELDRLPPSDKYPEGEVIVGARDRGDVPEIVTMPAQVHTLVDGDAVKDQDVRDRHRLEAFVSMLGIEGRPSDRDALCAAAFEGVGELQPEILALWRRAEDLPKSASRTPAVVPGYRVSASASLLEMSDRVRGDLMGDALALEHLAKRQAKVVAGAESVLKEFERLNKSSIERAETCEFVPIFDVVKLQEQARSAERMAHAHAEETARLGRLRESLGPRPEGLESAQAALTEGREELAEARSMRQESLGHLERMQEVLGQIRAAYQGFELASRHSIAELRDPLKELEDKVAVALYSMPLWLSAEADAISRSQEIGEREKALEEGAAGLERLKESLVRWDALAEQLAADRPPAPDPLAAQKAATEAKAAYDAHQAKAGRDLRKDALLSERGLHATIEARAADYRKAAVKIWTVLGELVTARLSLPWVSCDGSRIVLHYVSDEVGAALRKSSDDPDFPRCVDDEGSNSLAETISAFVEAALVTRQDASEQIWLMPVDPAHGVPSIIDPMT